jgi:hypothetical protein
MGPSRDFSSESSGESAREIFSLRCDYKNNSPCHLAEGSPASLQSTTVLKGKQLCPSPLTEWRL